MPVSGRAGVYVMLAGALLTAVAAFMLYGAVEAGVFVAVAAYAVYYARRTRDGDG